MKRKRMVALIGFATILAAWGMMADSVVHAQASLRYSCSAQVFEAFETERIPAFREATGINVEVYICSSGEAVNRLVRDDSDIASTAQKPAYPRQEHGYLETVFCKDALAIIVTADCPVADIFEEQLQRIFSRKISNWKELGGPDQSILLIVPGQNTAAYVNFERQVMRENQIAYDVMTYTSTQVVDAVKRFPWSISFITQGAVAKEAGVKTMRINGVGAKEINYPYYQEFSFITKGTPVGTAKVFVDFALSEKGVEFIKKRGMTPVLPGK